MTWWSTCAYHRTMRLRVVAVGVGVALSACGSSSASTAATTAAPSIVTTTSIAPATPTIPQATSTIAATTTTVGFSRESRLAVGSCRDALADMNFARGVAVESIDHTSSPKLDAAQALCKEAVRQLKADNAPSGSLVDHMLVATMKIDLDLSFAAVEVAGGHLLDPPCPNGAGCKDTILATAAHDYVLAVISYMG